MDGKQGREVVKIQDCSVKTGKTETGIGTAQRKKYSSLSLGSEVLRDGQGRGKGGGETGTESSGLLGPGTHRRGGVDGRPEL